jgi:DNA-directed RNA polymerase subunit L
VLEREFRSLEIYRCYKQDADGEPFSFDFTIETLGTMPASTIVYKALLAVATMAEKYATLDKADIDSVDIRPADARIKGYDLWFTGEDHTLGNMLQTWLDQKVGVDITFAGYKIPHPLRDEMLLRIGVEDGKQETVRLAVAQAAAACAEMYRGWAQEWAGLEKEPGTMWQAHVKAKVKAKPGATAAAAAAAAAK